MVAPIKTHIAVVGAGIIGLATAFRLAAAGREVVVIDPNEPGSGASCGNAGTLAPYACAPVGNPDVLRNLPGLLFNAESPLAIRLAASPSLVPWLSRFVRQSLPAAARRNGVALAGLLREAMPAWRELADQAHVTNLLRYEGCLYLYREKAPAKDSEWGARLRNEMGVRQKRLTAAEVAEMEPALPPVAGGLLFPDAAHIIDPAVLSGRMAAATESLGASFQRARVERLASQNGGTIRLTCGDRIVDAHTVVLAAGAWSQSLALQVGDKIPLDTERGYHVEFDMDSPLIKRPVSPIDLGLYFTPMLGRLRVAGTVELGGLAAPLNPARIALLERGARKLFPNLGPMSGQWLGFRPSLPDSLPVIGRSRHGGNLIHAFGHGHLGMTLAAITSRAVVGLIERRNDPPDLSAFAPDRFG
ncbi:MAG: FAD-dependent oxidoreductase [Hyphomicrobiales bacterium]|nr:FAD-dependent oxidoreductase [Hyphomicrobiales bacterium]MBV8441874.1 FAD-dependent oxidoreductase [Hyphomicrobiales bacterium]